MRWSGESRKSAKARFVAHRWGWGNNRATGGPLPQAASSVVSEHPGHATISITLDTYSHAIPVMQEEAAALIAGLVFADS